MSCVVLCYHQLLHVLAYLLVTLLRPDQTVLKRLKLLYVLLHVFLYPLHDVRLLLARVAADVVYLCPQRFSQLPCLVRTLLVFNFKSRADKTYRLFSPRLDVLLQRSRQRLQVLSVLQLNANAPLKTLIELLEVFAAVVGKVDCCGGLELG